MSSNNALRGAGGSPVHLRYARKLPYKAARLCALVAILRGAEVDKAEVDTAEVETKVLGRARREAHQLKGTAAAYGFSAVSRCAAAIEEHLGGYETMESIDWRALSRQLEDLLAAAKAQCERTLAMSCVIDTRC